MRYYFHLRTGRSFSPDAIGLDLPDLETAYLEAFEAARAMWGELLAERSDPLIRAFEIADEHGQILLTVPFAEVLERACKPKRVLPQALKAALQEREMLITLLREQSEVTRKTVEATR